VNVRIFHLVCSATLLVLAFGSISQLSAADKPPIYLWFEPEWFDGVSGSYGYWSGGPGKPTGAWGVAGPGISAEWTQGGESEWNSMGAPAEETKAACRRAFVVPRAGRYRVWVRYYDHRKKTEPFSVAIHQTGKDTIAAELGAQPVVPANDEYQLYWGFAFGWGSVDGNLASGTARLTLSITRAGEAWRQVDAVLITDDLAYTPVGREKPPFGYLSTIGLEPKEGAAWGGSAKDLNVGAAWKRPLLGGRDFSMWTGGLDGDAKWWTAQKPESLTLYDILFQNAPPADIRERFHKQFAGRRDVPVMSWGGLLPGMYLGSTPDLSPGTPLRQWLERTKTPFFILTNYASGNYNEKNGPATYQALTGPLAGQFLGYIHGEAVGTAGTSHADKPLGKTRREHVDAFAKQLRAQQAAAWSKVYKTTVAEEHFAKGISCLSVDSIALAHLFHEHGMPVVGYEIDATNMHAPMRIAFERGAARQYGQAWINYASGNFGDACNYFTQQHMRRGAQAWFHSKYAITDGVSASWYRKLYYLNYLGGASAIYWEQGLSNQYILPGPGTHPIQLSPFGRATEDFQAFVDRLPDRGEPYAPIGILLSHGHAYERVNYSCKMLHLFPEDRNDIELRELFNVCWHPAGVVEGQPAAPDVQSMPSGRYGNIFDVLVDRPARAKAIFDYPVIWAAGDVDLPGLGLSVLRDYVARGGTLVVNIDAARGLPADLLGLKPTDRPSTPAAPSSRGADARGTVVAETWMPDGGAPLATTPYEVSSVELAGAKVIAWADGRVPLITRNPVGAGSVIVTLCPRMLGQDERAHPVLPYLLNGITAQLLPVEVRLANGHRPAGEIMHQLNRTKDGWLVTLVNNQGVDKTQHGVARVDRRRHVDVVLRTALSVTSAKEYTEPRDLPIAKSGTAQEIRVRVQPGDVQVVHLLAD
jgi:hypothetical protein